MLSAAVLQQLETEVNALFVWDEKIRTEQKVWIDKIISDTKEHQGHQYQGHHSTLLYPSSYTQADIAKFLWMPH